MTQTQQTVLALAIYTIWIALLYIRIFDKTLKKYVLSIGVLLAFWMVVRMLKTYTTGYATEILWYLYYIPLLLIPTFYYNCSSYLINSKNKKRRIATIIISTILFLLVLTNSLHNIVFKIKSNINDYNHNIGYFIIVAWILCLIVVAIINLIKSSKNKGYQNIISISITILIGVVYTILYIKNVPVIRKTNMSVIIGTLFCVGLEMMLDFNLIPNNFRYKKIFKNSNLPLEIISQDGKTRITTNHSINLKENIINDIKDNKVKNTYKDNNIVKNVKAISGGYSIEEKDFSKINEYEKELKLIQQELIEQETILQKQRRIATEIYETKLKSEIIELLDEKIEQKRNLINELIKEMKITDIDKMQNIKLLLNYCKRMSSLVISSYNKEKYDNKRLEIIINEMLIEAQALGINGVLKTNNFEISSGETANIYEIIFETIMKFKETNFILYIQVNNSYTEIKYLFDSKHKNFKKEIEKLQLEKLLKIEQIVDEDGTTIINKNKIDYVLEYIGFIIIFITIFMQEYISRKSLLIIAVFGIIYEMISLTYMYFKYYKREAITDFSIKKVIDECEFGILVLKGKETKLINNKMYEILNKLNIKKDYITNIIKQSIDKINKNYCIKLENKYYVFVVNDNEIITFDITEVYELHQKLNEQNIKLEENNKQILLSIDNIEELEKEKNLLKLKNKYHDILGQNLSILQQYLNRENISQENFEEIKFMIQKMFIDIEDTDDTNTNLENLIKIHKKNGTDIIIDGKLPQNKELAKVFFEVIREATTNAIRHAGSSKVFVNIKETLEETYMIITNDGRKPNEFITENQGIKDMRRKVKKLGGMFYISTVPEFSVNILIKNNC